MQSGRLTCTVGSDQGDDLSLIYFKADAFDGVNTSVIYVNIIYFKHRHGFSPPYSFQGKPRLPQGYSESPPQFP